MSDSQTIFKWKHPLEESLVSRLKESFLEAILGTDLSSDMLVITVSKEHILAILNYLYQEPTLHFQFLTTLCGIDEDQKNPPLFAIVYHLHSLENNLRIRIKAYTEDREAPTFPSIVSLFSAADWMEREAYDFFGFNFVGHPNLKRILNMDDMTYFPMRKKYPLEDQTRTDKSDEMFGR